MRAYGPADRVRLVEHCGATLLEPSVSEGECHGQDEGEQQHHAAADDAHPFLLPLVPPVSPAERQPELIRGELGGRAVGLSRSNLYRLLEADGGVV